MNGQEHETSHTYAPIIAISRHRLAVDGKGVTTLVAFHGCPLRCHYCINKQCWEDADKWQKVSTEELLNQLMIDDLYFLATGGGVCFGGGEPLLHSTFIKHFCQLCPEAWNIYLESSLAMPTSHLEAIAPYVAHYYIDVKDMNADIYRRYTGHDNSLMLSNLHWLSANNLQHRVTIRLPQIPSYNNEDDRQKSQMALQSLGFINFERFEYIV